MLYNNTKTEIFLSKMNAQIKIISGLEEPYVEIYTSDITDDIQNLLSLIKASSNIVTAQQDERTIVLKERDIYMIRIENEKTIIYCKEKKYYSKKRLYELENILKHSFMKISKTTLVNLQYIDGVEASFGGTMLLILKNGCKDYVSRKYLPGFKEYLGL